MAAALPKAEQYEKTRSALLTVAHKLFAERGYADTSIQDIMERAEVTRGALYYHFHNKETLFKVVFERFRQSRMRAIMARMQERETSGSGLSRRAAPPLLNRCLTRARSASFSLTARPY